MLVLLRCQVHMEIAHIEEDGDRIEAAVEHLQKALHLNNGGQYEEYLRLSLKRLQLCTMLYKSPECLEDRAALMIEQVIMQNKVSSWNRFAVELWQRKGSCLAELHVSRACSSFLAQTGTGCLEKLPVLSVVVLPLPTLKVVLEDFFQLYSKLVSGGGEVICIIKIQARSLL